MKKKKLLAIILIIALTIVSAIVLTACGDKAPAPDPTVTTTPDPDDNNQPTETKLSAPTNVTVSGTTLSWTAVANASGYKVNIDGVDGATISAVTYSLAALTDYKTYSLKIKAIGNGTTFTDSDYSSITSYTVPEPDIFLKNGSIITGLTDYGRTLSAVTVPASITAIDDEAFRNRTNLTAVSFAEGSRLTRIGAEAFRNCSNLVSITIPNLVTSVGMDAFINCNKLTVTWYYNPELTADTFKTFLRNVIIPKDVTGVAEGAFSGCTNLSVTWYYNPSVTADEFRSYLKSVIISKDVTTVASGAFDDCDNPSVTWYYNPELTASNFSEYLTEVIIPEDVTRISDNAFQNCNSLLAMNIPSWVSTVGKNAFDSCNADITWYYNPELRGLVLYPNSSSVQHMGELNFINNLKTVIVPEGVTAITPYSFYLCTALEVVIIGNSVTAIEEFAFSGCRSLNTVVMGHSVERIEIYAFSGCTNLESIVISSSVSNLHSSAFYGAGAEVTIYIEQNFGYSYDNSKNKIIPVTSYGSDNHRAVVMDCTLDSDDNGLFVASFTYICYEFGLGLAFSNTVDKYGLCGLCDPVRLGYIFSGWNTAEDGTGTTYPASNATECSAIPNGTTLYAIWTKN